MLKGNLSTRPFYNDRLVTLVVSIAALLALALTAYDASRLYTLASRRRALQAVIRQDESEAARIEAGSQAMEQRIDAGGLRLLANSTREANDLIEQRTFSWTALFGLIEKTLPLDVRIAAVSPRIEKGVFRVNVTTVSRRLDDINDFIEAMQSTGAFYDVTPTEQQRREDGTYSAAITASYLPSIAERKATPAAASSTGRAGADAGRRAVTP